MNFPNTFPPIFSILYFQLLLPPRIKEKLLRTARHQIFRRNMNSNDLRRVFQSMDKNGDGVVFLDELKEALEKTMELRFSVEELESVVGKVTLGDDEFLCIYKTNICRQGQDSEEDNDDELVEAFKVFDENGDGFISSEELERALMRLGMCNGKHDFESMICVYDLDSDGRLDFQECKKMMNIKRVP